MTAAEKSQALTPAPVHHDHAALHSHDDEAKNLKSRIVDLLAEVESLRQATDKQNALEDLVVQLRQANQNLVIATFGAQDMQANAEAAIRRQEEFLTMLAHELRNPLAPIVTATELLEKIIDSHPALPKLKGIIERQVKQITHLVDDLLDASRFSGGRIALQKHPHLLSTILDSAVETSQSWIDKRNQKLVVSLPHVPIVIDGDLVRLAQVFSNLLINASKYSPEHEQITVSVRQLEKAVAISIKDNGIGMTKEMQPFIFDLFMQGFRSLDRSQGGLGIGLSLVRTIAEAHGGSATAHSEGLGLGSEMTVVLPISTRSLSSLAMPQPVSIPNNHCRILLIEDNVDANDTLNDLLMLEGHTVTIALDGTSGVEMAKANDYDVIICDIGLPGLDGFEVVRQLRQHALTPLPCFIALSGYSQQQNRVRAIEVGFNHYLVKPIATDVLLNIIGTCVPH